MDIRRLAISLACAGLFAPAFAQDPGPGPDPGPGDPGADPGAAPGTGMDQPFPHTAPQTAADPAGNLNDLYAFIDPNDPGQLIVVVTFHPFAARNAQFSDDVEYRIHFDNEAAAGGTTTITCRFEDRGNWLSCEDEAGTMTAAGSVEASIEGDGLQAFAGLTGNPAFFDHDAFERSFREGSLQFADPGTNRFADSNVQTLVLSIPHERLTAGGTQPELRVYASSHRVGGDGITAGFSGAWFNPDNPGHGLFLHVLPAEGNDDGGEGQRRLVASWLAFDGEGNPLYLTGVGTIEGHTATIPMQTQRGGRFPPEQDADAIETRDFGEITIEFTSCNEATLTSAPTQEGFTDATVNLQRLTQIDGLECEFFEQGQIARVGRPGVRSMLIDPLGETGMQDEYNRADDITTWGGRFQAEIEQNLARLDALDGTVGNAAMPAGEMAALLADDRLRIDTRQPGGGNVLGLELGEAGAGGGRTLDRDAMDDVLGAWVGEGVIDHVEFGGEVTEQFPFFGAPWPHQRAPGGATPPGDG